MTKWWLPFLLVCLAWAWISLIHDPQIRRDALQGQRDTRDNATIDSMAKQGIRRDAAFQRERDSTARVIAKLRARVIARDSIVLHDTVQVAQQLDTRDTLIAGLERQHVQDSLQTLFWKAQALAYRDSVVPQLVTARDNWRRAAQPGVLAKIGRALPYIAAGLVIGRIVR